MTEKFNPEYMIEYAKLCGYEVTLWDDGEVTFEYEHKEYGTVKMTFDLKKLETFVKEAREWFEKREEMKNAGTQP